MGGGGQGGGQDEELDGGYDGGHAKKKLPNYATNTSSANFNYGNGLIRVKNDLWTQKKIYSERQVSCLAMQTLLTLLHIYCTYLLTLLLDSMGQLSMSVNQQVHDTEVGRPLRQVSWIVNSLTPEQYNLFLQFRFIFRV